jgi:hypothetical protein
MELLRDADPVVEGAALLFEEAGLGASAACLRSSIPLQTLEAVFEVCAVLKSAQDHELVSEMAFWAEGALLSAADGDIDLFNDCLVMCKRAVAEAWIEFAVH